MSTNAPSSAAAGAETMSPDEFRASLAAAEPRALDAMTAVALFPSLGMPFEEDGYLWWPMDEDARPDLDYSPGIPVPGYSDDADAALAVVEATKGEQVTGQDARYWRLTTQRDGTWCADLRAENGGRNDRSLGRANGPFPRAVVEAALLWLYASGALPAAAIALLTQPEARP